MQLQGIVGPQTLTSLQPGTLANLRQSALGELTVNEVQGRYYEGTYRRARFGVANQAAVATTAAFATTYTGLVLYNPPTSTVNVVVEKAGFATIVAQTGALIIGLMVGQSTTALSGVTAVAPRSKLIGSGVTGTALAGSAATLPVAPTLDTVLGYVGTGATTAAMGISTVVDLGGDIVLPPGGFTAFYTSAASAATSLAFSLQYSEVPV